MELRRGSIVREPHTLPAPTTPLIGRDADLAELGAILQVDRIVTLAGAGGCGKTRLATELARRVMARFPGGVTWVDLGSRSDGDRIAAAVASLLDVAESPGETDLERIVRVLRARSPSLLVLDNAEHLLGTVATITAAIASGAGPASVLVTSREPLGVPGEVVWRVPSLRAPRAEEVASLDPAAIGAFDAVQLFVDRARRARRGYALTEHNAVALAQICSRLDGLPLAIELAAARVRTMPAERIAAQLDDRFRLLTGGARTSVARQQTLRASVSWSEDLLDGTERAVFRRVGVFAGGFTAEAAEAVVSSFGDVDAYDVAEAVNRLVDKSLVSYDADADRFGQLETIRSYALDRLMETGETGPTRDAHAAWCASWLESPGAEDQHADVNAWWDDRVRAVRRVEPEWPNCASALGWATPGSQLSLRLVAGLGDYWAVRQRASDSARFGMPALVAGDRSEPLWLTAVLRMQAIRTTALDAEFAGIRAQAVEIADARGDRRAQLRLGLAGHVAAVQLSGPRDDLLSALATVRDEAVDLREWYTAWNASQSPAIALAAAGRNREAEALVVELRGPRALLVRAVAARQRGEIAASLELMFEVERLLDADQGSTLDRMIVAYWAAEAALASDDRSILDALLGGDVGEETLPRSFFSTYAMVRGVGEVLAGHVETARTTFAEIQPDLFISLRNIGFLAQVEMAAGDTEAAAASAERLVARCAGVQAPLYETTSALVLAECEWAADAARALEPAHLALATAAGAELWLAVVDALEALGAVLLELGRQRDAARLLAAAEAGRLHMAYRHRFAHRAAYVAQARQIVQDDDEWAQGSSLSLAEAVELARRMRGERIRPSVGWDSLTPTERLVVEQVVAGLTNPQIADRLLMSRATVKTHLVHVFAKLGLHSRSELAAAAARRSA